MISLSKSFTPIAKAIKDNPNNKNPILWASWLVPMGVTPLARYAADSERDKSDRVGLSLEMFTLYTIGTMLYFTFNPIAGLVTKRLFRQKSEHFHNLAGGIAGSLVSSLFSGFYANRLGDRLKQGLGFQCNEPPKDFPPSAAPKRSLDEVSLAPSFGAGSPANQFGGVGQFPRQSSNFGQYNSFRVSGLDPFPTR